VFSLVYISRVTQRFSPADLLALLTASREKNHRLRITGMLLYKDGNFMQLLEGEEAVVRELYATIASDPRHCNVTVISEETHPERLFPAWSMGFQDLAMVDPEKVPGYTNFLNVPLTEAEFSDDPSRGQKLLLLFKRIG